MKKLSILAYLAACLVASNAHAQGYGYYAPPVYSGAPATGGYGVYSGPFSYYGANNGYRAYGIRTRNYSYYSDNAGNRAMGFGAGTGGYYQQYQAPARNNPFAFPTIGW